MLSARGDARLLVEELLAMALRVGASDVHVEPTAEGCEVRLRVDGLLQTVATLSREDGQSLVTRLMVMGQLLTYRLNVPQEGRIHLPVAERDKLEMRLSIMPTTHGLRAALRMPAELTQPDALDQLNLPAPVLQGLMRFAACDSGMLLLTGPAGSGKTTTIYALLRYIQQHYLGLSIIALEDPVERDMPGVTQIEVKPFGELTYDKALRSMLRQDPQVLMLGEIRDAATASIAIQAALSGHRLISTLHAGTPAGAIARLLEMKIEPYQISSSLYGIVAQRLLRRREGEGYRGRLPAAEFADMDDALRQAVAARADLSTLTRLLSDRQGHQTMRQAAKTLIQRGLTDEAEVQRVFGPS